MCENEGAGLYPHPHSFHPFFPPDPGGCRGYADVAQSVEHRAGRYALVQVQPSAPWQGAFRGDTPLPLLVKYKLRPAKAARLQQLVLALDAPVQFRLGIGPLAPLNDVAQRGHYALWLSWKSHSV